jgi:hypothetical protein
VTAADEPGSEGPIAFLATTVNVYAVPLVKPVNTAENVEALLVTVVPPGDAVTV